MLNWKNLNGSNNLYYYSHYISHSRVVAQQLHKYKPTINYLHPTTYLSHDVWSSLILSQLQLFCLLLEMVCMACIPHYTHLIKQSWCSQELKNHPAQRKTPVHWNSAIKRCDECDTDGMGEGNLFEGNKIHHICPSGCLQLLLLINFSSWCCLAPMSIKSILFYRDVK